MQPSPELTPIERDRYTWQMWSPDFGEAGQRRLKGATVLVSRIGGVGGTAAIQLAAAGIGRLILAHAGNVRLSDLNRQILMTTESVGTSRVETARQRLHALNPHVEVEIVPENVSEENVARLVGGCDAIVSAAPLFAERLLLNREAVRQKKPLVDSAMYDFDARLMTIRPGKSACLACLYPELPPHWKREFPVFGAVASTVGALAALEIIKLVAGVGEPLDGLLTMDLRDMTFRTLAYPRRPDCAVCGSIGKGDTAHGCE